MSRTRKDNIKRIAGKTGGYKSLPPEDRVRVVNFSKNPSWWNSLFNNKPKKRVLRRLLKQMPGSDITGIETLEQKLPSHKRPSHYYW